MLSRPAAVAVGVGVSLAAWGVGFLLNAILRLPVAFISFFCALFAASWLGGRAGGYTAMGMCAVGGAQLLLVHGHPTPLGAVLIATAVFCLSSVLIVEVSARLLATIAWRETMMSIVSHDLKQPLSAMKLQAEVLGRAADKGSLSPSKVATQVDGIRRGIGRLEFMINNLLDLARIRAGRLRLVPEQIDLPALLRGVVDRLSVERHHGGYRVTLSGAASLIGEWDRLAIEQIAINLLSNAIKYGEGKPVEIAVDGDGELAWFTVKDHGRGIPLAQQRRLFTAFEQGDHDRVRSGHGLGLWVVKRLTEAHGGAVSLESREGAGSVFRVELPRRPTTWRARVKTRFSARLRRPGR